jgi:chromosome segregation ATPase
MLTVNKLEKIIELEENLRAEYQQKIDTQAAEIETHVAEIERCKQELAEQREKLQATIDTQLTTITDLTSKALANQKFEQQNRELNNRSDNLQNEVSSLKARVKGLQKDLATEREELKTLKQFDPAKMKKNLDANKKKLAEKTSATDLLQKSLNKTKAEKAELEAKVVEVEGKLSELQADLDPEEEAA